MTAKRPGNGNGNGKAPRVLLIDNYDSFTHNLFQLLSEQGAEVFVLRNDALEADDVPAIGPSHIVLSPGPGHPAIPSDVGVCPDIIHRYGPSTPLLGVCLGHQGIVHELGGRVVRAPSIVHGKSSRLRHDGEGLFAGLAPDVEAMRYHSFVAERASLPDCLRITATTEAGEIMAVAHREWPTLGLQFHPESIGTPEGRKILGAFLTMEQGGNPPTTPGRKDAHERDLS